MNLRNCIFTNVFVATMSVAAFASAQTPPAVPKSSPLAAPSIQAAPSATPVVKPVEKPSPPQSLQEKIDHLSEADIKQILPILKATYANPEKLSDEQVDRALAQGLLERLGAGAKIVDDAAALTANSTASPFRAEILDGWIGYLRIGSISQANLAQLDSSLQDFQNKSLAAAIVDLRATPESTDYAMAAEFLKRFSPKGKMLFAVKKPSAKQERIFTSNQDPRFKGLLVVIVNRDSAGAAEVIAGALRLEAQAMVVGEQTRGEAAEYSDTPLHNGKSLRVAVSLVTLPQEIQIFPNGLKPDLAVSEPMENQRTVLEQSLQSGVSQFVFEQSPAHFNEASLAAGTSPEEDSFEGGSAQPAAPPTLHDRMLQRAVDLITTLHVFVQHPNTK